MKILNESASLTGQTCASVQQTPITFFFGFCRLKQCFFDFLLTITIKMSIFAKNYATKNFAI